MLDKFVKFVNKRWLEKLIFDKLIEKLKKYFWFGNFSSLVVLCVNLEIWVNMGYMVRWVDFRVLNI